jgi:hypothetical protein
VIEIGIEARKGGRARCRCCRRPAPIYHTRLEPRRWRLILVWATAVFLVYRPRRLECARCGVHVEHLPWAGGKLQALRRIASFLCPVGAPAFLAGGGFVFQRLERCLLRTTGNGKTLIAGYPWFGDWGSPCAVSVLQPALRGCQRYPSLSGRERCPKACCPIAFLTMGSLPNLTRWTPRFGT